MGSRGGETRNSARRKARRAFLCGHARRRRPQGLRRPSPRQAQGQAKAEGRYKGPAENVERNAGIATMLKAGQSWSTIQNATGCSRATVAKIAKLSANDLATRNAHIGQPGLNINES